MHARLIASGELGEITHYRGRFLSMYGSDELGLLTLALHDSTRPATA